MSRPRIAIYNLHVRKVSTAKSAKHFTPLPSPPSGWPGSLMRKSRCYWVEFVKVTLSSTNPCTSKYTVWGAFSRYGELLPPPHEPLKNSVFLPQLLSKAVGHFPNYFLKIPLSNLYLPRGVPASEFRTSFVFS